MQEKGLLYNTFLFIVLIFSILVVFSHFSFDIYDWPSDYAQPHNSPVENWCGKIGAFLSYYSQYYFGSGAYVILFCLIGFSVIKLFSVEYHQLCFRFVGMALLTTAVATLEYLLIKDTSNSFPQGNGGILGIGTGIFLTKNLAELGTYIILICSAFAGLYLISDTLVMMMLRWIGIGSGKVISAAGSAVEAAKEHSDQLKEIWKKLSIAQQKSQPKSKPVKSAKSLRPSIAQEPEKIRASKKGDMLVEETLEEEQPEEKRQVKRKKLLKVKPKKEKPAKAAAAAKPVKKDSSEETIAGAYVEKSYDDYDFPPIELLHEPEMGYSEVQEKMVKEKAYELESSLNEFGVNANVVDAEPGPAITMYELELAAGIKVSQISNLSNDMARALGAQSVRVVAPLPGRHTIGIEVPNSRRETVRLKELIEKAGTKPQRQNIPLYLGKDSAGEILYSDLAAMPHLLIAGTTGSGKSVCINSIITSILMTRRPDEVKLILIDPKMVEMTAFDQLPHLMCPIVTEASKAEQILDWATTKMDERYALLSEAKVRNIADFNRLGAEEVIKRFSPSTPEEEAKLPKKLPYIVIIVDELADLMMTSGKEIEAFIVRLAQKSRAVGIHMVLATQRPQATVVTGLIKSNMPARISFRVASRMDSRIILDQNGGETLLGQGDMLFLKPGTSELVRSQGAFLDDNEVNNVVDHLKSVAKPQFHPELMQLNKVDLTSYKKDEMFDEAVDIVLETKRGSVSLLQRRLGVGYARASRMIEMMAASGILGEYKGSQAREVMISRDEWQNIQRQQMMDAATGYSDLSEDDEDDYQQDEQSEDEGLSSENDVEYEEDMDEDEYESDDEAEDSGEYEYDDEDADEYYEEDEEDGGEEYEYEDEEDDEEDKQ